MGIKSPQRWTSHRGKRGKELIFIVAVLKMPGWGLAGTIHQTVLALRGSNGVGIEGP